MFNPLGVFIDPKNQRLAQMVSFAAVFTVITLLFLLLYASQIYMSLDMHSMRALDALKQPAEAAVRGFDTLEGLRDRQSCTGETVGRLRDVSFEPDGINEFLFIHGSDITCSSSLGQLAPPLRLSEETRGREASDGLQFRFGINLAALGHHGQYATLIQRDHFAAVLPQKYAGADRPHWLEMEGVLRSASGVPHHVFGRMGLFLAEESRTGAGYKGVPMKASLHRCTADGRYCVASRADIAALAWKDSLWIVLALVFSALLAGFVSRKIRNFLQGHYSFEARFRRNLTFDRVICTYQAIYDTRSRAISGCEVLTRWCDLDGSVVYPDRFLPLLEADGRMMEYTEHVVRKAFEELNLLVPAGKHVNVSFNISPQDLTDPRLLSLFDPFLRQSGRFSTAIEIVESARLDFDRTEKLIRRLREKGIKTYIDDFGSGYSNMENLARLSVEAVKLDKSFALAPPHSLMAEMLDFAVRMAQAIGRTIVVEGVETAERLEHLLGLSAPVHFVQGYFISRPVDARSFVALLTQGPVGTTTAPPLRQSA